MFPLLKKKELPAFLEQFVPEFAPMLHTEIHPLPKQVWKRFTIYMMPLPLAVVGGVLLFEVEWVWWSVILLPLTFCYQHLRFKDAGWGADQQGWVLRSRWMSKQTVLIVRRAMQMRTMRQSVFSKRAGLAKFKTLLASGSLIQSNVVEERVAQRILEDQFD